MTYAGWNAIQAQRDVVNSLADEVNSQIAAKGYARAGDYAAYLRAVDTLNDLLGIYHPQDGLLTPSTDAEYIRQWRRHNGGDG